ncbi:MAG: OmpA family protein [Desulfatitalea sp.]|nr:OmpA family protein [Desulfatitalea sp.]
MKRTIIVMMLLVLTAGASAALAATDPYQISTSLPDTKISYQTLEEGKLLVSVTDSDEKPIQGLTQDEFVIRQAGKTARIISVEPLETSQEVGLNIVLVVDNSFSMRLRNAIAPLTQALESVYRIVRPIDQVSVVVFDEKDTLTVNGHTLRAKVKQSDHMTDLQNFLRESMDSGLTEGTYLNEAILAGVDLVRKMPAKNNKFMVIFSDGEDINSRVTHSEITKSVQGINNFSIYAVDYMPTPTLDPFLKGLASSHGGYAWKAGSPAELVSVFEAFSSTLLHRYIVTYRFISPPAGNLVFPDPELKIEELTTIDSAPLLNHVYFDTGRSQLTDRYILFETRAETAAFDERQLRGGMDKYHNVLNILGQRLQANPGVTIRLVGCNSDMGEEKGRLDLSRGRAEAVQAYLRYVWGIAPERMAVEQRNLPEAPSNIRIAEGRIDNQRVEIHSDHPAILETVDSEYVTKVSEMGTLRVVPEITSEAGVTEWQLTLGCAGRDVHTVIGNGPLPEQLAIPLTSNLLDGFAACEAIDAHVIGKDNEDNPLDSRSAEALPVNFVQRTQQMAAVQGYRVQEQYALILFDFDSAAIKDRNEAIVNRIITRIGQMPEALVLVVGHTDNIGSEAYNLQLSERRAKAVEKQLMSAAPGTDRLIVSGAGPNNPRYDNALPEGRALNRTVTVTLEYFQQP